MRSALIALGVGAAVLVLVLSTTLYLVMLTQYYVGEAVLARKVRLAASDLYLALQQAETGQRGYLLTHDQSFLNSYDAAIDVIDSKTEVLADLLGQATYLNIDFGRLKAIIGRKVIELKGTVELARNGKNPDALKIVRNEYGLRLMTQARGLLDQIIGQSDQRLLLQVDRQRHFGFILKLVTGFGAITILVVIAGGIKIVRQYVQELLVAQDTLKELNQKLEQRVRERTFDVMRAHQEIQRYAYIITHDLRAPLINIMGFTSELEKALATIRHFFEETGRLGDPCSEVSQVVREDVPEAIGFILSSARKMDGLISAILKISRDGRRVLKPEDVQVEPLLRLAVDSIQHQVSASGGKVDISVQQPFLITDRISVEQIIANLLDNAVKYRSPTRPIEISIQVRPYDLMRTDIEIADNGRGIAKEDHERIFELFRRAGAQDRTGEGIGLAHVRSLVQNMGGRIEVASELGQGTRFTIRLPTDLAMCVGS